MLSKLKQEKKYLLLLSVLVVSILLVYYLPFLIKGVAYVQSADLRSQWYEFYYEFKRLIKDFVQNGNPPFYSWTTFLGNNFYASKGYYLVGDIYFYIGLFLNDNFFIMVEEITCLKLFVSAINFYILLTYFDRKPLTKVICSIAYAFSGFAIFFADQLIFLSFYSFVPLYVLAIEKYLKENKWLLFVIMCGFLFGMNFYFFYTLSALTPVYFIYRYFSLEKDKKEFYKSTFKLIGFYILGSSLTCFLWLPTVIYILSGNSRFMDGIGVFHNLYVYINYVISFFVPNYLYLNRGNMFETYTYWNREICCWASTILFVLIPQYTVIFNKTRKRLTTGVYVFFTTVAVFPILCSILHGFSNPSFRWTFFLILFNLMIISEILDNLDKLSKKLLVKTILSYILVVSILFIIGVKIDGNINNYLTQIKLICFYLAIVVLSYIIYNLKNKKVILLVVSLEVTISGTYFHIDDINNERYIDNESMYRTVIQNYYGEVNDYLNSIDEDNSSEFYRVYIDMFDVYFGYSLNANILYGIKGLATYDTTYSPSITQLNNMVPENCSYYLDWIIDIKDMDLMDFLNTKYAITTADYQMDLNKWELIDDNYGWGYYIYKNKNYKKFGIAYDKVISIDEYETKNDTSLFNEYVIADEETINKIKSYLNEAELEMEDVYVSGNTLTARYSSSDNGFAIISIPYDEGWKIQVDGEEIAYYNVNGGFIGFNIKQGEHELRMYFIPSGLKVGAAISFVGIASLLAGIYLTQRKRKYE